MENTILTEIMVLREKNTELVEMLRRCHTELTKLTDKGCYPEGFLRINGGKGLLEIESLINSNITE